MTLLAITIITWLDSIEFVFVVFLYYKVTLSSPLPFPYSVYLRNGALYSTSSEGTISMYVICNSFATKICFFPHVYLSVLLLLCIFKIIII